MERKLVFLDIDGTLTPAGSNVPPLSAINAIRKARENGHLIFLCTGRNPDMLSPLLVYGFDGAVACCGGYVFTDKEVLFDCPMPEEQLQIALKLFKDEGVFRTIEAKDATFGDEDLASFLKLSEGGNSEISRWRKVLSEQLGIKPMSMYDGRPVYKIVFMCERGEQLEPAKHALEKDFKFVVQEISAHNCLNGELINRKFDKGKGVNIVAKHFGFLNENTIGFGDSMNDLEMMQAVGTSVCMANGSPSLKKISTMVCPSVDDNGLSVAFEKLSLI